MVKASLILNDWVGSNLKLKFCINFANITFPSIFRVKFIVKKRILIINSVSNYLCKILSYAVTWAQWKWNVCVGVYSLGEKLSYLQIYLIVWEYNSFENLHAFILFFQKSFRLKFVWIRKEFFSATHNKWRNL